MGKGHRSTTIGSMATTFYGPRCDGETRRNWRINSVQIVIVRIWIDSILAETLDL